MESQVLHTLWCIMAGEDAGEHWNGSLLGVKGLNATATGQRLICVAVWLASRRVRLVNSYTNLTIGHSNGAKNSSVINLRLGITEALLYRCKSSGSKHLSGNQIHSPSISEETSVVICYSVWHCLKQWIKKSNLKTRPQFENRGETGSVSEDKQGSLPWEASWFHLLSATGYLYFHLSIWHYNAAQPNMNKFELKLHICSVHIFIEFLLETTALLETN